MPPLVSLPSANESGETPLDIARRLKHEHCEELVSVWPAWVGALPGSGRGPPLGGVSSEPGSVAPDQIPASSMGRLGESVLGGDHSPPSDARNTRWRLEAGHVDRALTLSGAWGRGQEAATTLPAL